MFKPILALLSLSLWISVAIGQENSFRDGHPDSYVVQRGDTLWDIARRFLDSPWLWPEIWHANPQIDNPHLIYPGDTISMIYVDGSPRLTLDRGGRPVVKLSPTMRSEPLDGAIRTIDLEDIQPYLDKRTVLNEFNPDAMPYVVANEEGAIHARAGDYVYIRGLEGAQPGDEFAIVRPTVRFIEIPPNHPWETSGPRIPATDSWEYPGGASAADTTQKFWRSLNRTYWESIEVLGYEVLEVAVATLVSTGDPSTLEVTASTLEVSRGDLVMPLSIRRLNHHFLPTPPEVVPDNARIIGMSETLFGSGRNQVVAINKGAEHGIKPGHVFASFRGGETIRDEVKYPKDDFKTYFSPSRRDAAKVKLPDEYSGLIMVFETFDRVSYALIMEAARPVKVQDYLFAP